MLCAQRRASIRLGGFLKNIIFQFKDMNIKITKISDIKFGRRNRGYNFAKVKELAQSIEEIGLLHPIIIDADDNLIAGLHRLEAANVLGWEVIPASVIEVSVLEKEIAEIDENLIRAELTELEKADLLCRAKAIYELRHPESKRLEKVKHNLKQYSTDATIISESEKNNDNTGFTDYAAVKLDKAQSSIRQSLQISKTITPEVKELIKNTPIADNKTELLSLAHIEPEKQLEVVGILKNGNAKKVKEAIYQVRKDKFQSSLKKADMATATADSMLADIEVSQGDIFQLGNNILICGDNTDPAVIEYLRQFYFSFCFADPPYNLKIADYDKEHFIWGQDYVENLSDVVAVIPGAMSLQLFMKATCMNYRWALCTHFKNLHSGSPVGYTHFYITLIFSGLKSIHRNTKDFISLSLPNIPEGDKNIAKYRQKPAAYLTWLIEMFSNKGGLVLDIFAGSGQTLMVCEVLGRKCVTVEILPEMVRAIIHRFENKFGIKALKLTHCK
jgi:ParB family chromosome partitioning protein